MKMTDLIPQGAPAADAAVEAPAASVGLVDNLRANIAARNVQPINPITNTTIPKTLDEALQIIEDQKRIIQTYQANESAASSERQMQG
jgi:hypothetical protein